MATERLNSILSHLTPSKSGLSAMSAVPRLPHFTRMLTGDFFQQHTEEPGRCGHHPCDPDAFGQGLQGRLQGYSSRLYGLHPAQESH